jgi:hypothetical protein
MEAVIDRRIGTIFGRTIAPSRTTLEHVHDARDHAAIINPMRTFAPSGKQRLDLGPLPVTQPGQLSRHQILLLNSTI